MTLSLALAFFLAATLGADAAPARPKTKPRAGQLAQTVTVSGECTRLIQAGRPVGGCKNILVNTNDSTGVSGYWFMTGNSIVSFAGDGARRLEQASDQVIQSIDRLLPLWRRDQERLDDRVRGPYPGGAVRGSVRDRRQSAKARHIPDRSIAAQDHSFCATRGRRTCARSIDRTNAQGARFPRGGAP